MTTKLLLVTAAIFAFLLASPAPAATTVSSGDAASGSLSADLPEAGFELEALAGTTLRLKVRIIEGDVRPEILLYDPEDVRVPFVGRYREKRSKAKLRRLELAHTGRYTIVVRAAEGAAGRYRLKVGCDHPTRIVRRGGMKSPGGTSLVVFPGFAGTNASAKVKGADGLRPELPEILRPDTSSAPLLDIALVDRVARLPGFLCEELGDHRLAIEGLDDSTGRYKARIRLRHPARAPVEVTVDGEAAGTFTSDKHEPPEIQPPLPGPGPIPGPGPNPGPGPQPVSVSKETPTFRLTIGTTVPLTDPWPHGTALPVFATLENKTSAPLTVTFWDGGIADLVVKNTSGAIVDGIWAFPAVVTTKTFQPFETWTISGPWATQWVAKGTYFLEGRSSTSDPRVPQGPRFQVRLQ